MSTPFNGPQITTQDVDAWLLAAAERRAALHLKAASPWPSHYLQDVLTEMSALLQEAFEEVRVVSESVREESQDARNEAAALRARSAQLMARGDTLMDRMAQFVPPSPEALRQAERRMLDMFKHGREHKAQEE